LNFSDTTFAYIILIPSDSAFQRWHPIDWGFYPFSVPEFTENILLNHVVQLKQPINLKAVEKEQKFKTLGGDYVVFKPERKFTFSAIAESFLKNSCSSHSIAERQQRFDSLQRDPVQR
jgi:hypothetical protein